MIGPHTVGIVIGIIITGIDQPEAAPQKIIVGIDCSVPGGGAADSCFPAFFSVRKILNPLFQLLFVPQADRVEKNIAHLPLRIQNQDKIRVLLRPVPGFQIIGVQIQLFGPGKPAKKIHAQ